MADFLRVDENLRYLPGEDYYAWRFDTPTAMLQAIFRAEHFLQGNVCYHHALIDEVGRYDEELQMAEDLICTSASCWPGTCPWCARTLATCTASTPAT
ncbi:hypothetical protein [Hymenobacter nivis]|uniref:hypothetical protein n=1 Tax=Hymenobacter nivis TaxID=1850093 RepID=UPI001FE33129|nr:hypothetical protein [Hymenobacter nivis]